MDEKKLFEQALKQIELQFGKDVISDLNNKKIETIPTGSIQLDQILGIKGYPKGRVIEIYGNESCGKTTLALQAIAASQKEGCRCAYIDLEHALDATYCIANGIDLNRLILSNPESGEQTFSLINALVKTGMIDLIVVDSVAAMVPEVEVNGPFTDQTIGLQARIMSKGLRILQPLLSKYKTTIIFINQIREKVGVFYGNNETTTGGRALKFYSTIRLELKRSELLKEGSKCVGIRSLVKVVKNKLAPPLYKTYIDFYFDQGIDHTMEIIDFAMEHNIITKRGAWFYFNDIKIGQGKNNTKEFLLNNTDMYEQIKQETLNFKETKTNDESQMQIDSSKNQQAEKN